VERPESVGKLAETLRRALSEHQIADEAAVDKLFGPKFLLERPLLEAVRAGDQAVLLIDEIDRADDEFDAFLLELLPEFQISIPETARSRPGARRSWCSPRTARASCTTR
jgi:MoxR-like ATPase